MCRNPPGYRGDRATDGEDTADDGIDGNLAALSQNSDDERESATTNSMMETDACVLKMWIHDVGAGQNRDAEAPP